MSETDTRMSRLSGSDRMKIGRTMVLFIAVPLAAGLLSLLMISIILSSSRRYMYTDVATVPSSEAALILGAAILRNGNLSPVLKDRVDQAIELYRAGKVQKIIASGDNSTEDYNEVQPIREYLIDAAIPDDDIVMDYAGFDTYSSIYRARDIFLVKSLTIVSQSFHLPRAVFIARKLGLDATGISADRGHYKLINYFREMAADVKAVLNLFSGRKPKYLGKELPIGTEPIEGTTEGAREYTIPLW